MKQIIKKNKLIFPSFLFNEDASFLLDIFEKTKIIDLKASYIFLI